MAISYLQRQFIDFAAGMPSVAISWQSIERGVTALRTSLAGVNPNAPAASMDNIPMPLYRLAYSVFVNDLSVSNNAGRVELIAKLTANVHPIGQRDQIIRSYVIETIQRPQLILSYDDVSTGLYWTQQGSVIPTITPSNWLATSDAALALTTIPVPQRDNYLSQVEVPIIWLTGSAFISLVTVASS